jgi:hypothetical protein
MLMQSLSEAGWRARAQIQNVVLSLTLPARAENAGSPEQDPAEGDFYLSLHTHVIQYYSEFRLYLNLTRPLEKGDS